VILLALLLTSYGKAMTAPGSEVATAASAVCAVSSSPAAARAPQHQQIFGPLLFHQ
jgi:hypothetical protein